MATDTKEEFLKHFDAFENNYPLISRAYENPYGWPEMDTLRHEACLCIAFGLGQSAITICNHLMESLLKYSLIYHHSINNQASMQSSEITEMMEAYTEEGIKKYDGMMLGQTIAAAFSLGLIEENEKEALNQFCNKYRNAYSHADKDKTFDNDLISVQGAKTGPEGMSTSDPVQVLIARNPITQSLAQAVKAKNEAPEYFQYLDNLVRKMKMRVFPNE